MAQGYTAEDIIRMTNEYRQKQGLPPLTYNETLSKAAQLAGQDLSGGTYWSHNNPNGKQWQDWLKETGYSYKAAGQNLANGYDSATSTMQGWINSPTHQANLVNHNYSEIGVALVPGKKADGKATTYVVQMFGMPMPGGAAKPAAPALPPIGGTASTTSPTGIVDKLVQNKKSNSIGLQPPAPAMNMAHTTPETTKTDILKTSIKKLKPL